jgi:hypothetical protein
MGIVLIYLMLINNIPNKVYNKSNCPIITLVGFDNLTKGDTKAIKKAVNSCSHCVTHIFKKEKQRKYTVYCN